MHPKTATAQYLDGERVASRVVCREGIEYFCSQTKSKRKAGSRDKYDMPCATNTHLQGLGSALPRLSGTLLEQTLVIRRSEQRALRWHRKTPSWRRISPSLCSALPHTCAHSHRCQPWGTHAATGVTPHTYTCGVS